MIDDYGYIEPMKSYPHNEKIIQRALEKGFVLNSRFLPYDKKLTVLAKKLRSNMTEPERRLWFKYLNTASPRFHRQYPIDSFIVDFTVRNHT